MQANNLISAGLEVFDNEVLSINHSVFNGNSSDEMGGAIANYNLSILKAEKSVFKNNEAPVAGGIYSKGIDLGQQAVVTINHCKFARNAADSPGSALAVVYTQGIVKKTLFLNNSGEAISEQDSSVNFVDNVIAP